MIRLSEAMARMHCSEEVQPKHVQEAFRLLNKSIIRVETPEINFEADEPRVLPDQQDEENKENEGQGVNGVADDAPTTDETSVKPPGKKIRVTYEQYRKISNVLILHLKRLEDATDEGIQYSIILTCVYMQYCMYGKPEES